MSKLSQRDRNGLINRYKKGEKPTDLSKRYGVCRDYVYDIINEYKETGLIPLEKKRGRKKTILSKEEKELITECWHESNLGADGLETYIEKTRQIHIPHNKIHAYLLSIGAAVESPKKKHQRKYCRYQRVHSMTLWHTDWKEFYINGEKKYLTIFIDDASRYITCFGVFDSATTENALKVLTKGIASYGIPDQIITDNGSQYCTMRGDNPDNHTFGLFLRENGIKHIRSRVHHPQTNGKAERFFREVEQRLEKFETIENLVNWQNSIKPHRSLGGLTPEEVFWCAQSPERIMGNVNSWFWELQK